MKPWSHVASGLILLLGAAHAGWAAEARIWDTRAQRFVSREAVLSKLAAHDYVLLGERHDNPEHHDLQASILTALANKKPRAAVMEMLRIDQQDQIDQYFRKHPGDTTGFAAAVSWDASGWPAWAMYAPVVSAAVEAGFPVLGGDVSKAWLTQARSKGLAALDPAWLKATGLDQKAAPNIQSTLRQDIIDGHCGFAPEKHLPRMIEIQRLRDAHLAWRLSQSNAAVLIAGAGHVRKDVAVPVYLTRLAPGKKTAVVAFVETEGKPEIPADAARYDYLWFTAAAKREDPCLGLRERLTPQRDSEGAASRAPRDTSNTAATTPTRPSPSDLKPETPR